MGKSASVALGAVVIVVKFAANFLGRLGLNDLSFDGMGKKAVEAVFAVSHIEVNAGVEASIDMLLATLGSLRSLRIRSSRAFIHCKVLVGAQSLDVFQLHF